MAKSKNKDRIWIGDYVSLIRRTEIGIGKVIDIGMEYGSLKVKFPHLTPMNLPPSALKLRSVLDRLAAI